MRPYLRYIALILSLSAVYRLQAQQIPLFTQYLNNGFLLNPAIAGSDGYTSFNATYRKQWVGFENSPMTYAFSGQTRMLRKSFKVVNRNVKKNSLKPSTKGRVGLGGFVFNDQNGMVGRTGISFSYAYHIYLQGSQISFGLSGQAFQYKIDASGFVFGGEDRLFNESTDLVSFIPDANAGFYWTSENYFVGFSANQLFKSVLKLGNEKLQHLELLRHYYLMGGYRFPLSNELDIEPSILVKTTEQWITQADMTIRLAYLSNYWLGFSYRTSGAIATICGISLDKFNMGISYDYSLNSIQKHSLGSAEVVMVMKFGSNARRYRWVNRY